MHIHCLRRESGLSPYFTGHSFSEDMQQLERLSHHL